MGTRVDDEASQPCRAFAACAVLRINSAQYPREATWYLANPSFKPLAYPSFKPLACVTEFSCPNKLPGRPVLAFLGCHQPQASAHPQS